MGGFGAWGGAAGCAVQLLIHHSTVDFHNSSRPEVAQGTRTGLGQLWLADHQFGPLATVDSLLPDVSTMDHFLNPSVSAIPRPDLTIPRCKNRFTGIRQGKKNK